MRGAVFEKNCHRLFLSCFLLMVCFSFPPERREKREERRDKDEERSDKRHFIGHFDQSKKTLFL